MSNRARIRSLERERQLLSIAAPSNHDVALASLLGAVDGLFWPVSYSMGDVSKRAVLHRLRRQYHETGIEWSGLSDGKNAASWKSNQRLRESLLDAELITMTKTKSTPLVKPTESAHQRMRSRLGLFLENDRLPKSKLIAAMIGKLSKGSLREADPMAPGESGWFSEQWLFHQTYAELPTRKDWLPYTEQILPLLVCGSLESNQTTTGHICYRSTVEVEPTEDRLSSDEAFEKLKKRIQECRQLEQPTEKVAPIEEPVEAVYYRAFDARCEQNKHFDPAKEIFVPLPATCF